MKRKLFVVFLVVLMLLGSLVSQAFAATSEETCKISVLVSPNNPAPGDDVTISVSLSEIKTAIKTVKFTLGYEDNIFESANEVAGNGWKLENNGKTYTLTTTNSESTTQTGNIATISLRVKSDVESDTQAELSFSSISATTDTEEVTGFRNLKQIITISTKAVVDPGSDPGDDDPTDNPVDDPTDDPTNDNEITDNEVEDNPTNEVENDVDNEIQVVENKLSEDDNDVTVNNLPVQKINEIGGYTTDDKLPQTGEEIAITWTIVGLSILSIISFIIYRRNKIN